VFLIQNVFTFSQFPEFLLLPKNELRDQSFKIQELKPQ
jgi:hypothetical protein